MVARAALALLSCAHGIAAFHVTPKRELVEQIMAAIREEKAREQTADLLQLQRSEAAFRMCHWGPEQFYKGLSGRAQAVWMLAFEEAGLTASEVSDYGCNVPKMPWSWVERIQAMDHTKVHNYNFQGSYMFSLVHQQMGDVRPQYKARNWLIDFVKENFTDADLLKISDVTAGYKPMGPYDKSKPGGFDSHHPNVTDPSYFAKFDDDYFQEMARSNFTLCPGGDRPWSMRFYEAIAAGSIPVINSAYFDTGAADMWALWEIPYKYYILENGDTPIYRQDWVDHNMELFIKYQTFHEGDNQLQTPEGILGPLQNSVMR